jgi:CRP-like cAMP-binding protein
LLEIEPDLARYIAREELPDAERVALPVVRLARGQVSLGELLTRAGAFAAVIVDGVVLQSLQVWERTGLRLLGPGDVLGLGATNYSALRSADELRCETPVSLALLGREVLLAAHRWPRLVIALLARVAEQSERVSDQLVICQLPRVEDRALAMMWQLAQTWGYVTSHGTVVPLSLTHETLGGMVGARRSTVTLALGRLAEQGAMFRTGDEWLLVAKPPASQQQVRVFPAPSKVTPRLTPAPWQREHDQSEEREAVRSTVVRLRAEHQRQRHVVEENLSRLRSTRARLAERRQRIAQSPFRRRSAPSG